MIFSPIIPGQQHEVYFYGDAFKFHSSTSFQTMMEDGTDVVKPAPNIDMFIVDQHLHANRTHMGDVYCVSDIREFVELVPQFQACICRKNLENHLNA